MTPKRAFSRARSRSSWSWPPWPFSARAPAAAEEMALDNGRIRAEFNDQGLVSIGTPKTGRTLGFSADPSSVTIDGTPVVIGRLGPAEIEMTPVKIAYRYRPRPLHLRRHLRAQARLGLS